MGMGFRIRRRTGRVVFSCLNFDKRGLMKSKASLLIVFCVVSCVTAFSQAQAPQGPPKETLTPYIQGVVAAGTKVQIIKDGFDGTEGPIGMPDGSLLFTNANRIMRIDKD